MPPRAHVAYSLRVIRTLIVVGLLVVVVVVAAVFAGATLAVERDCVTEAPSLPAPAPNAPQSYGPLYETCEWRIIWTP
jgi:hypothetical protein